MVDLIGWLIGCLIVCFVDSFVRFCLFECSVGRSVDLFLLICLRVWLGLFVWLLCLFGLVDVFRFNCLVGSFVWLVCWFVLVVG